MELIVFDRGGDPRLIVVETNPRLKLTIRRQFEMMESSNSRSNVTR